MSQRSWSLFVSAFHERGCLCCVRRDGCQIRSGTYREARGARPNAIAFDAEDGGLVDVARADEAV